LISYKILSIEAKDLFGAMRNADPEKRDYSIRSADGNISLRKFTNAFDWSLDAIHLAEVYEKRMRRKDFSFKIGRHHYTKNVICVTFQYSYKEFNMAGKNTYIRNGYNYRDCVMEDGVCVKDGELIAIQTNVEVHTPIDNDVLGDYFTFSDGFYTQVGDIPTLMDKAELRDYLYHNGFKCDGIEYVRYKRSSGSSRVGKCLFVNKALADDMTLWDKCGLKIEEGQNLDLAAWEAYISLPMSSIIDTVEIPLDSILIIDDYESVFDDEVVAVEIEDGHLVSNQKNATIKNSIWDGQSLMDSSLFEKYPDKGMLLLRNRFFKSCCFNTNLQQWFEDNHIVDISQLNGFTLAKEVSQIKLVTTPSSIKYLKFGTVEQWLSTVDPVFGIVKYEKPPHAFDGRMVQAHYQLFNTLQLSYKEMEKILEPSLKYLSAIRRDPAVLRYQIKFPVEDNECVDEINALKSKNEIVFKLLGINDKFARTKMYYAFRDDLVRGEIRNLKQGHVLVNGNYSTLLGNGIEMLKACIGTFDGASELGVGNIHSRRFEYGQTILGSRSPHITVGNILLSQNIASEIHDRYFNLSNSIVCINSIGENTLQRLNGADFDSDTMLLTDHPMLVAAAKRNYDIFKVPTSLIEAKKSARYYSQSNKADLDIKTSVNKIGEIVNLSQQLNSLMWDKIYKGCSQDEYLKLYYDICKLSVLSGVEIDRAKREFTINSGAEINILKNKYKITDGDKIVKPSFFKTITLENGYSLSENIKYTYYNTPMDYLQRILSKFNFREAREQRRVVEPFMSIVKDPGGNVRQGFYYKQRDKVINTIREYKDEIRRLYVGYESKRRDEKQQIQKQAAELKQNCVDIIDTMSECERTMYLILKEIDNPERRDISRFVFEVLFGKPNEAFFRMINNSKESIYQLVEDENGDLEYHGFKFKKEPIRQIESKSP